MSAFLRIAAAALAVIFLATPSMAAMDAAQKQEIETIVRDYLLANPEVLDEAFKVLQDKRAKEEAAKQAEAVAKSGDLLFNSPHQMVLGNPEGAITLVEFFDYNCGYCKRARRRHDGAARGQSRSQNRDEGIPDPERRIGRGGAHLRRHEGYEPDEVSHVPPGALLAAGRGQRRQGAGDRQGSRPRCRRAEDGGGRRPRSPTTSRKCTSSQRRSASAERRPT